MAPILLEERPLQSTGKDAAMKDTALMLTAQQTPDGQPQGRGPDAPAAPETPELPRHPCGSRTYAPDEVFTDPGTLVMIGI